MLRVHTPWVRRGRVARLRRLRVRLQETQARVARPVPIAGSDLLRVADRWAELEEFIDHVPPRADDDSSIRLFEELGRLHTALRAVWEPSLPELLDDHRTFGQLRVPLHWAATAGLVGDGMREAESAMTAAEAWWSRRV